LAGLADFGLILVYYIITEIIIIKSLNLITHYKVRTNDCPLSWYC